MLSKNKIKYINSLKVKKYRLIEKVFICEGEKIFESLVKSAFVIKEVFATAQFIQNHSQKYSDINFDEVSSAELSKISLLTTSQSVFAIAEIPDYKLDAKVIKDKLTIVLDDINDPGNLGTIIRIADWFGIENIICSENTVDVYNPKVVQASMGSVFNIKIIYTDLEEFIKDAENLSIPVYGTFMNGENIYTTSLSKKGLIVFGNEANGISGNIEKYLTKKISIPDFNPSKIAESLNVAVSAAIICSEFSRR